MYTRITDDRPLWYSSDSAFDKVVISDIRQVHFVDGTSTDTVVFSSLSGITMEWMIWEFMSAFKLV